MPMVAPQRLGCGECVLKCGSLGVKATMRHSVAMRSIENRKGWNNPNKNQESRGTVKVNREGSSILESMLIASHAVLA